MANVQILGLCWPFRDLNVSLKLKLQASNCHTQRLYIKFISDTVLDFLDLPF